MAQTTVTYLSTNTGVTVVVSACRSSVIDVVKSDEVAVGLAVGVAVNFGVAVSLGVTVALAFGVGVVRGAGEGDAVEFGVGVVAAAGPATAPSERPAVTVIAVKTAKIFFMGF